MTAAALEEAVADSAPGGVSARVRSGARRLAAALRRHAVGLAAIAAVACWLMRRILFTSGIPAGTDMLGFVSRARQNAHLSTLLAVWAPGSFGSRRTFSLDNVLGAITLVTRSPLVTVRLLDVGVLAFAGLAAYALSWRWFSRRLAAGFCAVLFMCSQASLSRWGSGQLNVEMAIALSPLLMLWWADCVERFSVARAIRFSLCAAALLLVRQDLVLWVAPFLVLYGVVALARRQDRRTAAINVALSALVALVALVLVDLYWLVPSLAGVKSQWLTLTSIFQPSQFTPKSLDLYPSLLGFGRELGYLSFTNVLNWAANSILSLWAYYGVSSLAVLFAFAAVWWYRDRRAVFLALAVVVATLAAPGGRPPLGSIYFWVVLHVPVVGNLRDPNRWLIFQALAVGLLAGLTLDRALKAAAAWVRALGWRPRRVAALGAVASVAALAVLLLPEGPTLLVGFRTWHVTPGQSAILGTIAKAPNDEYVATIPYDQDYRFLVQGTYAGVEHDLGSESPLFTGHPSVSDGSWNQRSANLVAYTTTLLARGDPSFVKLLAGDDVGYLASFHYPIVAPQLVDSARGAYYQQAEAATMPGLTKLEENASGTLYRVDDAAPEASFRSDVAVVLGGDQGIAALASRDGINLSDWAVLTASDLLANGGMAALTNAIARADLVLVADEQPADIALFGTPALAVVPGFTSDPQLDRLDTNEPTDESAQLGAMLDEAAPIPTPLATTSSVSLGVARTTNAQLWLRLRASPQAATVTASVDGRRLGSATPVAPGTPGFVWVRAGAVSLAPGTHRIALTATASPFGDRYEVEEARLVATSALAGADRQLDAALAAAAGKTAAAYDVGDVAKWSTALAGNLPSLAVAKSAARFWRVPAGSNTARVPGVLPNGLLAPTFVARSGRSTYTIVKHTYPVPRDWSSNPYLALPFLGDGSGKVFQVVVRFTTGPVGDEVFDVADDFSGWRQLALPISAAAGAVANPGWSSVSSISVALPSKAESGLVGLGRPTPTPVLRRVRVAVALPIAATLAQVQTTGTCFGTRTALTGAAASPTLQIAATTAALGSDCRVEVAPAVEPVQYPATPVALSSTGTDRFAASFASSRPGMVVYAAAYDDLWRLTPTSGAAFSSVPANGALNGYFVPAGTYRATLAFTGEGYTLLGLLLTLLFLAGLVVAAARLRWSGPELAREWQPVRAGRWRARYWPQWLDDLDLLVAVGAVALGFVAPTLRVECTIVAVAALLLTQQISWRPLWVGSAALVVAAPFVDLAGSGSVLTGIAYCAIVAFGVAALRLLLGLDEDDAPPFAPRPGEGRAGRAAEPDRAAAEPAAPVLEGAAGPVASAERSPSVSSA